MGRENDWTPPGRATSGSGLETTSDEQGSALISGDAIWTSKMCFASGFLRASTLVLLRMFSRKGEGGGGGGGGGGFRGRLLVWRTAAWKCVLAVRLER